MATGYAEVREELEWSHDVVSDWSEAFATDLLARPLVFDVSTLESDGESRFRADRLIASAGRTALEGLTGHAEEAPAGTTTSLLDALSRYAESGDAECLALVKENVRTDVIERSIKAGFVMETKLQVDAVGRILQHGQTNEQIQRNTLAYAAHEPQMKPRIFAEVRNMYRIEEAYQDGLLEDYAFVVISRCPDGMTEEEQERAGFFVDTASCAIQSTTLQDGEIVTESAFVAGKGADGRRHDTHGVVGMGMSLGIDLRGKDDAETIDTPLLVHKSLMSQGVIDLVALYDQALGGAFFGEPGKQGDYTTYKQKCAERETQLSVTVDGIVADLCDSAAELRDPIDAVQKLHDLSEAHLVERALTDHAIDLRVYGAVAAKHIEQARAYHARGMMEAVQHEMARARQTAVTSSCPSGATGVGRLSLGLEGAGEGEKPPGSDEDEYGSLTFTCPEGHTNRRPRGRLLSACQTAGCKAKVTC